MKTVIVLTGPQGSGNHLWSKILSTDSRVYGWKQLTEAYWIGHDCEPFNEYWKDPDKLVDFDWTVSDYYVTNVSIPYMENGVPTIPDLVRFGDTIRALGITVKYCIIGRDVNILSMQEQRLRGSHTYTLALSEYEKLPLEHVYYLSHELLVLYKLNYLKLISKDLNFPIDISNPKILEYINENSNLKYLRPIEHHWVDDLARKTSQKWK